MELIEHVQNHLQKYFGINRDECDAVITTYGQSMAANISDMRKGIENNELPEVSRNAHSLKGGLLNLGLDELVETIDFLEQAVKAENKDDCLVAVQKLESMLKELIDRPIQ